MPKKDEKPIMGLVSDKNFIVANAVENILAGKFLQNSFIIPSYMDHLIFKWIKFEFIDIQNFKIKLIISISIIIL